MSEERWKNLDIWKLADSLAYNIYLSTRKFPKDEVYGISSQLRRAALSVPTNIVEGYSRKGDKELAHRLGYTIDDLYESLVVDCDLLGKKLWRFYEKVK